MDGWVLTWPRLTAQVWCRLWPEYIGANRANPHIPAPSKPCSCVNTLILGYRCLPLAPTCDLWPVTWASREWSSRPHTLLLPRPPWFKSTSSLHAAHSCRVLEEPAAAYTTDHIPPQLHIYFRILSLPLLTFTFPYFIIYKFVYLICIFSA